MELEKLIQIGFLEIGQWAHKNGNLTISNPDNINYQNAIYAFVCDHKILYVGKTTNSLKKRFDGYLRPGPSQNTNKGVNKRILEKLSHGSSILIYAFEDKGLLKYGDFSINLAEGLEKSIIDFINPEWNGLGSKKSKDKPAMIDLDSNGFHTLEELDEIDNQRTRDKWNEVLKLRKNGLKNDEICSKLNLSEGQLTDLEVDYHNLTGN